MCLYSKTNISLIAEEDIECYKLVFSKEGYSTKYQSVCEMFPYKEGLIKSKGNKIIWHNQYNNTYTIDEGFLHTFTSIYFAKKKGYCYDEILRCIIPKGSKYFISDDGKEYASDKLLVCESVYINPKR